MMFWILNPTYAALQVTTLTPNSFQAAGGLTVTPNGDIYVADFGEAITTSNGKFLYKVSPIDGSVSVFASGFLGASGNVYGPDGLLYQSSINGQRVTRINADGTLTDIATAANGLSQPVGLTFTSTGDLFVANCGNRSISKIDTTGNVSRFVFSTLLNCPNGLTADDNDNLYAVNFFDGRVIKITPNGVATQFARTPGSSSKPTGGNGHIIFGNNQLYLVSNATHQVFSLTLDGVLTVIAGTGQQGRDDGDLLQASFSWPNGIDLSPDGKKLYVNDSVFATGSQIAPNVVRVVELEEETVEPMIKPNNGLTGAWYQPSTSGQGMLINIHTESNLFFMAWFTYDDEIAGEHRWLTVQGGLGDTNLITAPIINTTGGVFNASNPVTNATVGQATLKFSDCTHASMDYSFDDENIANGHIELQRITPDLYCELLLEKIGITK